MSAIGLRPFLAADTARCKSIFAAAIAEIAIEDYSEAQCEAWIAVADDGLWSRPSMGKVRALRP